MPSACRRSRGRGDGQAGDGNIPQVWVIRSIPQGKIETLRLAAFRDVRRIGILQGMAQKPIGERDLEKHLRGVLGRRLAKLSQPLFHGGAVQGADHAAAQLLNACRSAVAVNAEEIIYGDREKIGDPRQQCQIGVAVLRFPA